MEERRDRPPEPGTRPAVIVGGAQLSPLQQAWSRYVDHTTTCPGCRDIDSGRCDQSERLWRDYQAHGAAAYERLSDEA